jgi:mannose PTS system EIIA component
MADILLIAHAPLASALAAVAAHTFPDCAERLMALDVPPDMGLEDTELAIRGVLAQRQSAEVLMLCDVFGATPCNAALRVSDGVGSRVVAGANVPMLWRSLCYADEPLERLVSRAVDGAMQGVLQVSAPRRLNQAAAGNAHDPNQHHDQQ